MMLKFKKYFWAIGFLLLSCPSMTRAAATSSLQINYDSAAFTAPAALNTATSSDSANLPWEWKALTPAFDYSFDTDGLYDPSHPLKIRINYAAKENHLKQIFSFDSSSKTWRPLVTEDSPDGKYATATTNSTSGKLILLADTDILAVGSSSWYKYKSGLYAASPDFAKGTVLRVFNLANGKSVDVTINDWGPDRTKHPDRVVDLDYEAFKKIASPSAGVITVKIQPLKVVMPAAKKETPQVASGLNITASSAIVMLEKNGQVIWGKNEKAVAPLASLTKLVAIKVFLDTKPDLKKVVTYKKADETFNNKYCEPWESAKVELKDGDTLTIENLVYSSIVGSANNAVESLVRVSGLSRPAFIKKMNESVSKLGATSTKFIEPTGLSKDNVSSPSDYAIITKEILKNPVLKKISTTKRYSFKTINSKQTHTLANTNQLLKSSAYPIIGSKTGYLDEAGYCLMTSVQTPKGNLIAVNFHSASRAASFSDNAQLVRYGLTLLKK